MNWYQASKKYLEDKGYEYLGEDGGLLFYKDKDGEVFGISHNPKQIAKE